MKELPCPIHIKPAITVKLHAAKFVYGPLSIANQIAHILAVIETAQYVQDDAQNQLSY